MKNNRLGLFEILFGTSTSKRVVRKRVIRKKKPVVTPSDRETARVLVHARLEHFNQYYHFSYNKVAIRNQKTRWGSCSSKGNLNFSVRILTLAPDEQDYLIVHELCHLKEFNHSSRFWDLVAEQIPDYKRIRQILRYTAPIQ
ncbi:M48 family metallopeptidase [Patescibacteria group bacterium]|nr:M48 family metallopeptidase [Patescibacteria group bacterium]